MLDFRQSLLNSTLNKVLQRLCYPLEVMLTCVRWYVAYPLSLRHIEEKILLNNLAINPQPELFENIKHLINDSDRLT